MTNNQTLIFEIIKKYGPISAPDILRSIDYKINKTTIYRNLSSMSDKGLIKEVRIDTEKAYYELADLPHHHHFVCESCGEIKEVSSKNLEEKILDVEEKLVKQGLNVRSHDLEFYGNCIRCI